MVDRRGLYGLAELVTLTVFAVGQPLLDATGRSPEFFLYRAAGAAEVACFVAVVLLVPPVALWVAELGVGTVSARARAWLHAGSVWFLLVLLVIQVGKALGIYGAPLVGVGLPVAFGLVLLGRRWAPGRAFLHWAAVPAVVLAVVFFAGSSSGSLLRGAGSFDSARAVPTRTPPVVFLLLDEFPQSALLDSRGRVDARLFPNFARLARMSTWYPNATGNSGWTPYAAPSILSGRYPRNAAPSYAQFPNTLFTLLAGSYRIRAFETVTKLCPPEACAEVPAGRPTGLPALLGDAASAARTIASPREADEDPTAQFVEAAGEADPGRPAPRHVKPGDLEFRFKEAERFQPPRFTSFLEGLSPSRRPTLEFLHLLLPHAPWRYLPSGNEYPTTGLTPDGLTTATNGVVGGEPLRQLARQRLLLQLAYTDGLIGQLLDRLQSLRMLERAMLIVTADHGRGLERGEGNRRLGRSNPPDLAWVPLFVKYPSQRTPAVDERNAMQVDLVPTIADVLGVAAPWRMDGISLLGRPRRTGRKVWFDFPPKAQFLESDDWLPQVRRGLAPRTFDRPARDRMFAVGPYGRLVGRKVVDLHVGAPVMARAVRPEVVDLENVDVASGKVPAFLWGSFDRPLGGSERWVVLAMNGTVAGSAVVVRGRDGRWRYLGLVDDRYLKTGVNVPAIYEVDRAGALREMRFLPDP